MFGFRKCVEQTGTVVSFLCNADNDESTLALKRREYFQKVNFGPTKFFKMSQEMLVEDLHIKQMINGDF